MSRRNQSRRRRTYGRRQHEVRERRSDGRIDVAWLGDSGSEAEESWQPSDMSDDQGQFGDSYEGYAR